jgi:hypothetical protein
METVPALNPEGQIGFVFGSTIICHFSPNPFRKHRLAPLVASRNWLCSAHFPLRPSPPYDSYLCAHTPVPLSLASFRTVSSVARLRRRELGSFCTFSLRPTPPIGPNWVRFAHLASGTGPARGLSIRNPQSAIRNRGAPGQQIGFVLYVSPLRRACPRPDRGLPRHAVPLRAKRARLLAPLTKIGFVLRIYPPAEPNWVRFVHFASGARPRPLLLDTCRFKLETALKGNHRIPIPFVGLVRFVVDNCL